MSVASKAFLCCVNWPTREAPAADAFRQRFCALLIVRADEHPAVIGFDFDLAMVVAEIEFRYVALQVLFAHAMKRADDAALEDGEIAFNGVSVNVTAHVFARKVIDRLMAGNPLASDKQRAFAVRHQASISRVHLFREDRLERLGVNDRNMERAHVTAALNQREHALFAYGTATLLRLALAGVFVMFLAAYVGRVRFNRAAVRAEQARRMLHGFADAMGHEPRGLIGHAQHALKLFRADAFLAGRHQLHGLQPDVQLDLAALEHRPNRYGELLAAILALVKSGTMRLAFQLVMIFRDRAAMRAYRTVRPAHILKPLAGYVGVFKVRLVEDGFFGHG
jgi:hypothetical protein